MSVKILGGLAKGQVLEVSKGDVTRPTSVLLRRRLFDSRQNLEGLTFIDLCAGSGAIGLEAWSRGASKVHLIEQDRNIYKILKKNGETVQGLTGHNDPIRPLEYHNHSAETWFDKYLITYQELQTNEKESVILFLDPPYEKLHVYEHFLAKIKYGENFLGEVWIESDKKKGISESSLSDIYGKCKVFKQGASFVFIVR